MTPLWAHLIPLSRESWFTNINLNYLRTFLHKFFENTNTLWIILKYLLVRHNVSLHFSNLDVPLPMMLWTKFSWNLPCALIQEVQTCENISNALTDGKMVIRKPQFIFQLSNCPVFLNICLSYYLFIWPFVFVCLYFHKFCRFIFWVLVQMFTLYWDGPAACRTKYENVLRSSAPPPLQQCYL